MATEHTTFTALCLVAMKRKKKIQYYMNVRFIFFKSQEKKEERE
jgi:hypothetical protein